MVSFTRPIEPYVVPLDEADIEGYRNWRIPEPSSLR
jgi:hypothetical protein